MSTTNDNTITEVVDSFDLPPEGQTSSDESITLKYLGQEKAVSKNEAITLAQKGLDYDRIRGRYEKLKATAANISGDPVSFKRSIDIDEFLQDYPDVKPNAIPTEVWAEVKGGRSLSSAYAKWENSVLKNKFEAGLQNNNALYRTTGSRSGSGYASGHDLFSSILLSD